LSYTLIDLTQVEIFSTGTGSAEKQTFLEGIKIFGLDKTIKAH
jgi:hypothetical protein